MFLEIACQLNLPVNIGITAWSRALFGKLIVSLLDTDPWRSPSPNICYEFDPSPPLDPILSQLKLVHSHTSRCFNASLHIIIPTESRCDRFAYSIVKSVAPFSLVEICEELVPFLCTVMRIFGLTLPESFSN